MAGLARPRPAASRHSARHRVDRRPCSPAVRDVEAGCGRGWDAAALTFLLTTWPIITQASSSRAEHPPARTQHAAPRRCCWRGPAQPACWGGLRAYPGRAGERPAAGAADRHCDADRHAVVDCGQHGLHPALCRPAPRVASPGYCLRRPARAGTAQLPRLCLRRLHHRHDLPGVRHHAVAGSVNLISALVRYPTRRRPPRAASGDSAIAGCGRRGAVTGCSHSPPGRLGRSWYGGPWR